jgi:hypothetical protein
MTERWQPIVGFGGFYSVSDTGRVGRDAGGRGAVRHRVLTPKRTAKGYRHVDLSIGDRKTRRLIHQLVAEAFLPPRPTPDHHPNHLDGDKTNNCAVNLEWATRAENAAHAAKLGLCARLKGESNGRCKLTTEQVREIRASRGFVGQRVLAAQFGVSRTLIQRIHQGLLWSEE